MNSICITNARITNDLEIRYAKNNTAIVNFSVADNHRNGDKEEAIFWRFAVFGKQAEFLAKYGVKGGRVNIIGEAQPNNYTNKDGQQVSTIQVRVTNIEIVDWKPAEQQTPQQGAMPQMGQPQMQQPQGGMPQMGMQNQTPQGMPQMNQQPMGMQSMEQPQMQQPQMGMQNQTSQGMPQMNQPTGQQASQGMPNLGANNGFINIPDNLPFN